MQMPDGTVLMHGAQPYDPAKAHEYYLKYRQLHPRAGGSSKGSFTVSRGGRKIRLSAQELAEQKAYAAHRTGEIKARLSALNVALHKKLAEAAKTKASADKPPTAAEKAQAARDAKKYRDKHQQEIANKAKSSSGSKEAPVKKTASAATLKKEIVTTKKSLKDAVAKQRELAAAKKDG